MLSIVTQNAPLTMSTREIATLLGKQHSNIKVSAERLAEKGTIALQGSNFEHNGNTYTEYLLQKRDSLILVAQNCPEFTAAIVDRWQELENQYKPQLPDFTNPVEAARAWADAQERALIAEKTKAQINDKRTATIMGKLGHASKKIKALESQLQDTGDYRSLMAAGLPQRIDTEFKSNVQSWRVLKQISDELGREIRKVDDPRYGKVNTYHVDVLDKFKEDYM